jgi:elongation factor G
MEPALIVVEITPRTPADRQKLACALQVLGHEGDLQARSGIGRDCTVIGATNEAHLEGIVDRLKRAFDVEASVSRPTVAYQETLTRSAEGSAIYATRTGGHGRYAHVSLRVIPARLVAAIA